MSEPILNIKQLNARVEEKEILYDINLQIHKGETHVLMGPNGAGKSTLGYVLMGNPKYQVTGGNILFKGKDVTEESADKRAKDGMFLSFQEPLAGTYRICFYQKCDPAEKRRLYQAVGLQERAGQKSEISGYGSFLCRAQPECRLLWRRKEKSRNTSADDVKAKPCDLR